MRNGRKVDEVNTSRKVGGMDGKKEKEEKGVHVG